MDFYFEFLLPTFVFHFHKKMENEIQFGFPFFVFMKKLKKDLLKKDQQTRIQRLKVVSQTD